MTSTFVVCVGKERKEFTLHEHLALRSSDFFTLALRHQWREARERRVTLPEARPGTFEGYLQWLYTGQVTFNIPECASVEQVRSWILGDYLGDAKFCNAVVDSMVVRRCLEHRASGAEAVELAWDRTAVDSPLRAVILEIWSTNPPLKVAQQFKDNPKFSGGFVIDYLLHICHSRVAEGLQHTEDKIVKACAKHKFDIPEGNAH